MAKKKRPRKPYRRPNFGAEAARLDPDKYGNNIPAEDLPYKLEHPLPTPGTPEHAHFAEQLRQSAARADAERAATPKPPRAPRTPRPPRAATPRPKPVRVDKEPVAPAHPHVAAPAPRRLGRYLVPVAAGAGVVGGTAYLARRAERRKAEMAKGLIDPMTGDTVRYERVLIDDVVDKAVGFKGVGGMRGAKFKVRARDRVARPAHRVGRPLRDFLGEAEDTMARGMFARGEYAAAPGRIGTARRAGRLVGANAPALAMGGAGYTIGRLDEDGNKRMGPADRKKARAKAQRTSKRYDETALQHHGSRRGRNTPVSTTRTAGLPVQSASFSRGNPTARPGTRSHALDLTHVHTKVKHHPRGTLFHLGRRKAAPSPIGKSAAFAQSAGNGRRLTNV